MNNDKYWSYMQAREHLKTRLQANDDEISIRTYLGGEDGGFNGFDDLYDYKPVIGLGKYMLLSDPFINLNL